MPVLNKYKDTIPPDAVYIGRGSIWGSPFPMSDTCTREQSLEQYKVWVVQQIKSGHYSVEQLASLHGKSLVCFCAPKECHGHTLEKLSLWAHQRLTNLNNT